VFAFNIHLATFGDRGPTSCHNQPVASANVYCRVKRTDNMPTHIAHAQKEAGVSGVSTCLKLTTAP